jgi:general secretion pathway protein D
MRRSNNDVTRFTAVVVLLAFVAGCATPPRPEQPVPPKAVVPFPEPAPVVTPPAEKPGTTVSIGPRPAVVAPAPQAPTEPVPARVPAPAAPAPPSVPPVPPGQRGKFIVLNFDNADIETVIHAASEIVGFNYVIGPGVSGKKVTVQTSGRIPQEEVFGVLLAILEVHGVTAVKSGNLYKIVPLEGARERAVPTIVGSTPDPSRAGDEIITQIIPVRFTSVNDLGTLLRPLISTRGTLIANREAGVLIITDAASNISRLLDIIKLVDVEVTQDELQIIQINFADASELAGILTQIFGAGRGRATGTTGGGAPAPTPAAPAPAARPGPPGAPAAPAGPSAPGAIGGGGGGDRPPLIIAEKRSNSIIVNARRTEIDAIRRVISQIDVNVSGGRRVFIYFAENAKAKDLTATLNAIYGAKETVPTAAPTPPIAGRPAGQPAPPPPPSPSAGPGGPIGGAVGVADVSLAEGQFRFIADETTNSVIVTTTPRQWLDIEATVRQLDRMPRQVLIEVLVAEVTLKEDTRLGIDWALRTGRFGISNANANFGGVSTLPTAPSPTSGLFTSPSFSIPTAVGGAAFGPVASGLTAFTFGTQQFLALLNILASQNRVNIVSNPHVMTSENKKAIINVSQSVPIITGQQTSSVSTPGTTGGTTSTTITTGGVNQTVEYKDAGVILTVTPRIGERGTVALDVKQEVNAVGDPVPPTGSPAFTKREAETSVVLLNNQTLVLGGLIQDQSTWQNNGIPGLKNIPVFGYLFGFREKKIERTELLLLITPRVIGTALDALRVTDEMRHATPELNDAVRSAPRPPSEMRAPAPIVAPPAPIPAPTPSAPSSSTVPSAPSPVVPAPGSVGVPTIPQSPPSSAPSETPAPVPVAPAPLPPAAVPPPAR